MLIQNIFDIVQYTVNSFCIPKILKSKCHTSMLVENLVKFSGTIFTLKIPTERGGHDFESR